MVLRKCTICDRRFKKTEHFKRHERSHTKERPYECNVCHKRFSRSDVLSRHAKGHIAQAATATANGAMNGKPSVTESIPDQRPSAVNITSSTANPNDETPRLLPGLPPETQRLPNLPPTPRDVPISANGMQSTSLDFLADISAHHARTESDINPMMIDEQQPYFGWNEVTPLNPAEHASQRGVAFDAMHNDILQFWLEPRGDSVSHQGSLDLMRDTNFGLVGENLALSPERHHRHSIDTTKSGDNIPNERFAKVERCWLAPSNTVGRLMNTLWRDMAHSDLDNLFSVHNFQPLGHYPDGPQGSRHGLDEECRMQLQAVFGMAPSTLSHINSPGNEALSPAASASGGSAPTFPPAEILDMALDLYFRHFHRLVPFVHLPTFSAKKARLPLLFVMCLIGMIILGTKGTTSFVARSFPVVFEKVSAELAKCSLGNGKPAGIMTTFATAFLFLNLAAMTGEKEHLEQCQMLYVNLMAVAQRHGLFTANEGQILDMALFEAVPDLDMRWKAWSRVESAKRLIIGLLLIDSWYSSFLSTSPIVAPDSVQIILPCNETLFRAGSSIRWMQLIRGGKRILMPTVTSPSENTSLPVLDAPVDDFCMQGILAMLQLRLSEAYHRLLSNRASYPFAPCHTYAMDGRARCLPSLQVEVVKNYEEILERLNPNSIIMWHYMCMMLCADMQIFDLAAGRAGPLPARKALDDIAAWSQTTAARRACLHAAQIFKFMTNRKASDDTMFHSVFALFSAALVLGLYTFMVPHSAETQVGATSVELLEDIDWRQIGAEGFTSFMEPQGSQPYGTADSEATNFIRNGGTIYIRGVPHQGGYQSARRILLDYAGLLKDTGKWSVRKFSYVLHIMSDVLMEVE
ncbi:transcriptional regulator family: Fungal Specific TF and C2H2 zinc finger [Paecilomyces variotii]|nr:transcriptional regulator family: Fungal Specific TF and C2H2 zinc finger [Paecilomyces variotii]KAJ9284061.1 transcriptional regulator family: C2H2 zinc finger and Fungal Specific TF [Paecilomyces variotii]